MFFPRYKEGDLLESGLPTGPINISYEVLQDLFHLPLKDAARKTGLCTTTFKKACRHFDMKKWPFRRHPRGKPSAYARRNTQAGTAVRTLHRAPACAPAAPTLPTVKVHQDQNVTASRTTSSSTVTASRTPSGSTTVSSPTGLLQQALDTRSCGEAGHAGPPRETFAPLGEQGGEGAGPLREQSCVEAVMEYLEGTERFGCLGPLAGNFDFMFAELDGNDSGAEC